MQIVFVQEKTNSKFEVGDLTYFYFWLHPAPVTSNDIIAEDDREWFIFEFK